MVTVELMVIDLKAGLDNTSTAYKRLCKGAEKAGIVHQYSGVPLDTSPKQIFWVLLFDQGFDPKDLVWPKAEYGDFSLEVMNIATSPPVSYFVPFDSFPNEVVTAPVTEIAVLTLKDDVADYERLQRAAIEELKRSPMVHGACFGITNIDGRKVSVVFVGWDSVEAHKTWAKENIEKLHAIRPFIDLSALAHVTLEVHV